MIKIGIIKNVHLFILITASPFIILVVFYNMALAILTVYAPETSQLWSKNVVCFYFSQVIIASNL